MIDEIQDKDIDSLKETILWYSHFRKKTKSLSQAFRSEELKPSLSKTPDYKALSCEIGKIIAKRKEVLQKLKIDTSISLDQIYAGQILICEYNSSLLSGESEFITEGFFDIYDRPGWDTYFACFEKKNRFHQESIEIIMCWIPKEYFLVVNKGIDNNPYGCIYWAKKWDLP